MDFAVKEIWFRDENSPHWQAVLFLILNTPAKGLSSAVLDRCLMYSSMHVCADAETVEATV